MLRILIINIYAIYAQIFMQSMQFMPDFSNLTRESAESFIADVSGRKGFKWTEQIRKQFIKLDYNYINIFNPKNRTSEMYLIAVMQNGLFLKNVPKEHKSYEICIAAVRQNGLSLKFVPINGSEDNKLPPAYYFTPSMKSDLYITAVKQNGLAIQYILKSARTREIELIALASSKETCLYMYLPLQYTPKEYITQELCYQMLKNDIRNFQYIPSEYMNTELCEKAIDLNVFFEYLPKEYMTPDLWIKVLDKYIYVYLHDIPIEHRTAEIYKFVMEKHILRMIDIPEEYRTPEFCAKHISKNYEAIKLTPLAHFSNDICKDAIRKWFENYKFKNERDEDDDEFENKNNSLNVTLQKDI